MTVLCLVAQSRLTVLHHHGLSARPLCPGDSPCSDTGVGCHALAQGIFPTQGSNPGLPHCRWILYPLSHQRHKECSRKKSYWILERFRDLREASKNGVLFSSEEREAFRYELHLRHLPPPKWFIPLLNNLESTESLYCT